MKFVLLTAMVLLACSTRPIEDESTSGGSERAFDLPPGAEVVPFDDQSGMSAVVSRDGAGNLALQGFIRNNKREGTWTEYHPNGMVKSTIGYVDGKREGQFVELSNNGQLVRQCGYHNDLRHGAYKEYNFSTLKEERNYVNDNLEGLVKIYYPDGKIMEEGLYQNGVRNGVSKWYDQQGNVSIEYDYKNGQLVKK